MWALAHVAYDDSEYDASEVFEWWSFFGLPEATVRALTDLNLRFVNGQLLCDARHRDRPETFPRMCGCLMSVWRHKTFKDGRYDALYVAARSLRASEFLGIGNLMTQLLADPDASDYYIKAWIHYGAAGRRGWIARVTFGCSCAGDGMSVCSWRYYVYK